MGVGFVTGFQGDDPKYLEALSTPKRFAVHSGKTSARHSVDVPVSDHDLEDTHLPAFRATVFAGAGSVMCAYNSIDGKPACAQPMLLQQRLRDNSGFCGLRCFSTRTSPTFPIASSSVRTASMFSCPQGLRLNMPTYCA